MGSDKGPHELFQGILEAANEHDPALFFTVIATPAVIQELAPLSSSISSIRFQPVQEVIAMNDEPIRAVKTKSASSMVIGIKLLKKKKIDAFLTCGHTGALITSASLSLPKIPHIRRPALLVSLPSATGFISVIDVGGNLHSKAELLYQYAEMGQAFHKKAYKMERPKIGLLNIGVESRKGTLVLQEAFKLLSSHPDFIGNIEAQGAFSGGVDVLVTNLNSARGSANRT